MKGVIRTDKKMLHRLLMASSLDINSMQNSLID